MFYIALLFFQFSFVQLGYTLASNDGDNTALQLQPRLVPKLYLDGVKAKSIICGERHTTILSHSGDVWSFGSGESHQIGIMDNVDQFQPQKAVGLGPSASNVITHVSVGASISAAVNEAGEVYLWGYGVESPIPKLVPGLKGQIAQSVCVGSNANMALLTGSNKECYEWQFDGASIDEEETHGIAAGEAEEAGGLAAAAAAAAAFAHDEPGSSGHGGGGRGIPQINAALRGKKLIALSAGKNHYMAVTADGKLFAWGSNYQHECGLKLPGEISFVPSPLEVKFLSGPNTIITDVRCSVEHSIALDSLGRVHTWGVGFEGRLGHVSNADVPQPKVVQSLVDAKMTVTSIAIGPSNCGMVCADGSVWLCGAGNGGQIGNEEFMPQFSACKNKILFESGEKVTALALGNYHAMCLTEKGTIYTMGDNKFGQLGLYPGFQEDHAAYPQPVTSLSALHHVTPVAIECGDNVCMVLSSTGEIYGWGTGETSQLVRKLEPEEGGVEGEGEGEFNTGEDVPAPVKLIFPFQRNATNFKKIKSFSVRDINCCCILEDGSLYSWGWDLGEFPSKLTIKKPIKGSAAQIEKAAAAASASASTPNTTNAVSTNEVKFDKVALGHTRMLLITA
jgi:alpha-tubulin suppressor-like RCC1 family protein